MSARGSPRLEPAPTPETLLSLIVDSLQGIEAVFDADCRLLWISPSIERLSGWSVAECLQAADPLALLIHAADLAFCRTAAAEVLASGEAQDFELRLAVRDGSLRWLLMHWRRRDDGHGRTLLRLSAEDIQSRKETEYTLLETVAELRRARALQDHYLLRGRQERQRLAALLNLIRLGIVFIDHDRRVLHYNRALLEIWRYPADANLVGMRDEALQRSTLPLLVDGDRYMAHIVEIAHAREHESMPFELNFRDGRIVTARSALVAPDDGGRAIGRVWIYEDVTAARRASAQLEELAVRDPLTNLYNRRRFHEELERFVAEAGRRRIEVGLVMFDLDGFKEINDTFGHQAGDEVLVTLAERVGCVVRRNELLFRLGGDEFAVLVLDAAAQALVGLANRLGGAVAAQRFRFRGRHASVTASLGIARYPSNAADSAGLVVAADEAMYAAKAAGRNRWVRSTRLRAESARMPTPDSHQPHSKED